MEYQEYKVVLEGGLEKRLGLLGETTYLIELKKQNLLEK